jgi:hypothetical protein
MASKRLMEIINRFMTELTAAAEEDAAEAVQERLRGVLDGSVKNLVSAKGPSRVKRRKTTKGYTMLRPCPVPDCKEIAAPRYQMVCKGHSQTLSREEIIIHRDNATKPGGVWSDLKPTKKAG